MEDVDLAIRHYSIYYFVPLSMNRGFPHASFSATILPEHIQFSIAPHLTFLKDAVA
jgi:hypothetical protein